MCIIKGKIALFRVIRGFWLFNTKAFSRTKAVIMKGFFTMKNESIDKIQFDKIQFEKYAIFQTGGKQYQALPGKTVAIEKIEGDTGASVTFPEVLFRKLGDGKFEVGKPHVEGAQIKASIVKQTKGPKIIIFRFKRRKKSRVKKGHRQPITVVRIENID